MRLSGGLICDKLGKPADGFAAHDLPVSAIVIRDIHSNKAHRLRVYHRVFSGLRRVYES